MTKDEEIRMLKNDLYLQAKKIKKLDDEKRELMKQNREKDNKIYERDNKIREKDQVIARLRHAYDKVKGDC